MPSLYSDIIGDDAHWAQPNLDHAATLGVVGIASATDAATTRLALTNLSVHTPTVLAFTLANQSTVATIRLCALPTSRTLPLLTTR